MAAAAISFLPARKVKRFTKTCRACLAKLPGMTSATDQNPKPTSLGRKSANSGTFAENFRVDLAGNFLEKELA